MAAVLVHEVLFLYYSWCSYIAETMCHLRQWLSYNQCLALCKEICCVGQVYGPWNLICQNSGIYVDRFSLGFSPFIIIPCQKRKTGEELASTTVYFPWLYCMSLRAVKNQNDLDELILLNMKLRWFMPSVKISSCVLILDLCKGILCPKEQSQCSVHFYVWIYIPEVQGR